MLTKLFKKQIGLSFGGLLYTFTVNFAFAQEDASICFVVCDNYGLLHFFARLDQVCRSYAGTVQ